MAISLDFDVMLIPADIEVIPVIVMVVARITVMRNKLIFCEIHRLYRSKDIGMFSSSHY